MLCITMTEITHRSDQTFHHAPYSYLTSRELISKVPESSTTYFLSSLISRPSFNHVTSGRGSPVALHEILAVDPTVPVIRRAPFSILGGTVVEKYTKQIKHH